MAIGDEAIAAGMANVNGATTPSNTIDTELMRTRDYIAQGRGATTAATPEKVIKRDANGRAQVATPSATADIANKGYVDTTAGSVASSAAAAAAAAQSTANSALSSAGTANTAASNAQASANTANSAINAASPVAAEGVLLAGGPGGRINVGNPTSSANAANKGYADAGDSTVYIQAIDYGNDNYFRKSGGTVAGNIHATGEGRFAGAWGNNITGTRRAVWMEDDGTLGHTASARKFKQNIVPAELTLEQLRGIPVVLYRYRKQVAAERAGKIEHAALEIGSIADDLHDLGLWHFVIYDDEGKPLSIHYELLALAAISLGQQLADRFDSLEQRVLTLEEHG